ncbi:purine-cytosine permease family protein [Amycolatopsis methanolica]|uniref:purine-cytosine permease family protein n=1 Tax=Amycolatopsis methanolica TaxID=1814 RepID=UPI0034479178
MAGNNIARAGATGGVVERRSIDYIPLTERHGKAWHQGPFWLTGGFMLPSLLIGFLGPSLGLGLVWSLVAVVCGMGFGTLFMALHANQGPRLGLPQMIQSRAQFGSRGAIFPLLMAVFIYVGYNVFQMVLAGDAVAMFLSGGRVWYLVFSVVAVVIAVVGHDLLHTVQRYFSYLIIVIFAILTVAAVVRFPLSGATPVSSGFTFSAFLAQFAAAGGYQISYSIYVSDYTRYLPQDLPEGKLIGWTFLGGFTGAAWLACLGSLIASYVPGPNALTELYHIGDAIFPGFGVVAVLATLPALIGTSGVNAYGAMLSGITIVDGIRRVNPTLRVRITGVVFVGVVGALISVTMPADYMSSFEEFIMIMVNLLVPWTAVNLVDFYLVRHGRYAIADISDPDGGVYGRWAWRGLTAYFGGFLAMIPFLSLGFYTGPMTTALGGADIAFIVGLLVSGGLYLLLSGKIRNNPRIPGGQPSGVPALHTLG